MARGKNCRMGADDDKSLEVGKKAPAFSLPDQDDKTVKLADFKGSWLVLYFYPNDDTPGCTTEACDFTNGLKDFEKLDAVVVGCSPNTTESHRKFIAKYKLKVRLLSDPEHKAMTAYGAWGEKVLYGKKSIGVIRSTTIISPDGKIAHRWARVKSAGHADAVRDKLKALRAEA
jgi:peroxiredoxin Q/BCP